MVLKFKVWRLQREWHRIGHENKEVLTLRDRHGYIRKICKNPMEELEITRWYSRYNYKQNLENLLAADRLKEYIRRVKAEVRRRGFTHQISLYGITRNVSTSRRVYRRYEIFKASVWQQQEIGALHLLMKKNPPRSIAGVFIYHNGKLLILPNDQITLHGTGQLGYTGERTG